MCNTVDSHKTPNLSIDRLRENRFNPCTHRLFATIPRFKFQPVSQELIGVCTHIVTYRYPLPAFRGLFLGIAIALWRSSWHIISPSRMGQP